MDTAMLSALFSLTRGGQLKGSKSYVREFMDHILEGRIDKKEMACKKAVLEALTTPAVLTFCKRGCPKFLMRHFQKNGFPTHGLDKARCIIDAMMLLYRCTAKLNGDMSEEACRETVVDLVENSIVTHSAIWVGLLTLCRRKIKFTDLSVLSTEADFIVLLVPFVKVIMDTEECMKKLNREMDDEMDKGEKKDE